MSLRERVEKGEGEGETLRFGGSEERAVTVDKKVPEEEENGETTVGSGIVIAQLRSLPCAVRSGVALFPLPFSLTIFTPEKLSLNIHFILQGVLER